MKPRAILAGLLIVAFAAPAFADEFYIVRQPKTKKCTIVTTRPTTNTVTIIGDTVYKTRSEAEHGVKTIKTCTTDND